jgi:putative hydrolase of the HAD superfamily
MVRAVTFDLDGVYFTGNSFKKFKSIFLEFTPDQALIDHVLSKSEEILNFKKGTMSEIDYWNYVNQNFGTNYSVDQFKKLLSDSYSVNQNVVDTVREVRKLGIITCICTNNFSTRINALDQKFSFLSDFDVQVLSYQVGAVKPDQKIFQVLIDRSACSPGEIILADDKETNVLSAQSLGINAFVYRGFDHFIDKLGLDLLHL